MADSNRPSEVFRYLQQHHPHRDIREYSEQMIQQSGMMSGADEAVLSLLGIKRLLKIAPVLEQLYLQGQYPTEWLRDFLSIGIDHIGDKLWLVIPKYWPFILREQIPAELVLHGYNKLRGLRGYSLRNKIIQANLEDFDLSAPFDMNIDVAFESNLQLLLGDLQTQEPFPWRTDDGKAQVMLAGEILSLCSDENGDERRKYASVNLYVIGESHDSMRELVAMLLSYFGVLEEVHYRNDTIHLLVNNNQRRFFNQPQISLKITMTNFANPEDVLMRMNFSNEAIGYLGSINKVLCAPVFLAMTPRKIAYISRSDINANDIVKTIMFGLDVAFENTLYVQGNALRALRPKSLELQVIEISVGGVNEETMSINYDLTADSRIGLSDTLLLETVSNIQAKFQERHDLYQEDERRDIDGYVNYIGSPSDAVYNLQYSMLDTNSDPYDTSGVGRYLHGVFSKVIPSINGANDDSERKVSMIIIGNDGILVDDSEDIATPIFDSKRNLVPLRELREGSTVLIKIIQDEVTYVQNLTI